MSETILKQFILLSVFLLLGYVVRVWVKPLRKLFLPASLIGGVIGLILCPNVLGVIPVSEEWMKEFSKLPGVLITVVITASVLGIKLPKPKELAGGVGRQFLHLNLHFLAQIGIGLLVGAAFLKVTYKTFGFELWAGFAGGHGTAAMLGSSLKEMGVDWWLDSQGVGLTTATVGILGGILAGIVMINYAARKGYTNFLSSPDDLPEEIIKGYSRPENARYLGKQIQYPAAIEPYSFMLAVILITVGAAFQVRGLFAGTIIHRVAPWAWGIILMALIWFGMCKVGLDWLIDPVVKARLMGMFVDFLVVSAIISLPVKAVMGYIIPITVLCSVGLAMTIFITMYLGKRMLPRQDWFERSIINFGQCTGVGATGILLLRLVDPDFRTEALSSWSMAFALTSLYIWFIFAFMPLLMMKYGILHVGMFFTVLALGTIVIARLLPGWWNGENKVGNEVIREDYSEIPE